MEILLQTTTQKYQEILTWKITQSNTYREKQDNQLYNKPFTERELKATIKQWKNTSPGEDTTHPLMIKKLALDLYNNIREKGLYQRDGNLQQLHLIKGGKSPKSCQELQASNPKKYSLQNIWKNGKQEIDLVSGEGEKMDDIEFGFRKQKHNKCNIKINKILNGFRWKEKTAAIFFDIEKTYDKINKNKAFEQLENIGI